MGFNYNDLSYFVIPEFDIATEADDITKKVNDLMGGKNSPAEKESQDQREEDLTKTDNIFEDINQDDAKDNPVDNPTGDAPDTQTDTNLGGDNPTDDPNNPMDDSNNPGGGDDLNTDNPDDPMGGDTGGDDNFGSDPNDPTAGMDDNFGGGDDQSSEPSIFSDKNTLKENMIYFFNIIKSTISSLEDALNATDDQTTIRVINAVIHNMYGCKDILFKILTEQMASSPYETLVAKYITIKRIYDISCDMLEEHFSNNPKARVKFKRFKSKKR